MKVLYKSNFQLRFFVQILLGVLFGVCINAYFFDDWALLPRSFFSLAIVSFPFLLYGWLRPRQIADEILLEADDKLDFFNNHVAMAEVVSLGYHYGFERLDDYDSIRKSGCMKLMRKTDWLEDLAAAELKIYKTPGGQIKAEMCLKNRPFHSFGPGIFPNLFKFSQDLKLQLS
ncbi:MAG: hypothetical protein IPM92_06040 [Saprospiraceae bacterium]|nr:hypothetical protein [Saprospiraceae bacterium]